MQGLPPPVDEDPEDRHASARSRLLDTLVQIRSFMPRDMQAAPLLAGSLLPPAADRTTGAWRLALSIDATGSLLQVSHSTVWDNAAPHACRMWRCPLHWRRC